MAPSSLSDRVCARLYALTRRCLLPDLKNSQYLYGDELRRALELEGRWLDLGCGHDFLPDWMAPPDRALAMADWTTVGIDLDSAAIARHTQLRMRVHGNIELMPFTSNSFHLVTANMVVEHVREPEALFREVRRVLAPGGTFLIHTPNSAGYTTRLTRLIPQKLLGPLAGVLLGRKQEDIYDTYYRANCATALCALAQETGLAIESLRFVDSSPQLIRIPPFMVAEVLLIRALRSPGWGGYRACILATFKKER